MPHFLISGIAALGSDVMSALMAEGSTAVRVDDIAGVAGVCAEAGPGAFAGYIQLPATFTVTGSTAVDRVHRFFGEGVLARFPAVEAALPTLADGARITFVMGVLPPEVWTGDDVTARAALVRVLGRAACADGPPELSVSVLASGVSAREIALTALGRNPELELLAEGPDGGSYADWRVELLGMISAEM
ncbi:MAG: hypothetical protein H0X35_06465 [Pseudonocardiales bacterium]|nr:hypothetical protein [Pseudonocardiales bacterium]